MKRIVKVFIVCLSLILLVGCGDKKISEEAIKPKDEITSLARNKKDIQEYLAKINDDKDSQIEKGIIITTGSSFDSTGSYDNLLKFINKVNDKEEVSAIFVSETNKGDFIYNYVNFNGKDYYVLYDNEFDKNSDENIKEDTVKYLVFDDKENLSYLLISGIKDFSNEEFVKLFMSNSTKDQEKLRRVKLWCVVDHK